MLRFLIKGIVRDQHRSLFPVIVVAFGVLLTTVVYSFINGQINELVNSNAVMDTGHLKVMTRAYYKLDGQMPNDLGLIGVNDLMRSLSNDYPDYEWTSRIKFVGLLDVPDANRETKAQYRVFGMAVNLFNKNSGEAERLNLDNSIVNGKIPEQPYEILISDELAKKMNLNPGDLVTLLSTNSGGSMAVQNFSIAGTVRFGIAAMDRGSIITDLSDMQYILDMPDGAGMVLGFNKEKFYQPEEAEKIKNNFNNSFANSDDPYTPIMQTLGDQNGLREYLQYVNAVGLIIASIFLFAMSIVLLNSGIMSGIRRYGEIGVRLALGEAKDQVYKTLLYESVVIGIIGSLIGTAAGLGVSYYLQEVGIDISETLRNSTAFIPNLIKAKINTTSFYIGSVPGLLATLIGTAFSGIQIFKRQTASLFKELEV